MLDALLPKLPAKQPAAESPEPQELLPAVFDAGPSALNAVQPLLSVPLPHELLP